MPVSYVYSLGKIEPRFPRLSVEKEFAQATGRAETVNLTDRQALRQVLQQNRYLVKQLCWVMTVSGLETYIVAPRDPADANLLVETLRPNPRPGDVDLVVGMRGPYDAATRRFAIGGKCECSARHTEGFGLGKRLAL